MSWGHPEGASGEWLAYYPTGDQVATDPAFVFVDLETTGLNHHQDSILELALVITDLDLNVIAARDWTLSLAMAPEPHHEWAAWEMHQKNRLYEECKQHGRSYTQVEREAITFMESFRVHGQKFEMCGSSVHFDRRFLMQQLPGLEAQFHYRNLDVSTLKVMVNKWRPEIKYPTMPDPDKPHRAHDDCMATIAELGYYRDMLCMIPKKWEDSDSAPGRDVEQMARKLTEVVVPEDNLPFSTLNLTIHNHGSHYHTAKIWPPE